MRCAAAGRGPCRLEGQEDVGHGGPELDWVAVPTLSLAQPILPVVWPPVKMHDGNDDNLAIERRINETKRKPGKANAPDALTEPLPCQRMSLDPRHAVSDLCREIRTQPRSLPVVVEHRIIEFGLSLCQKPDADCPLSSVIVSSALQAPRLLF